MPTTPLDPWDAIDWWTSPATAYWRGLVDGAKLERDRIDWENDVVHRATVRQAIRTIETADRFRKARAEADAGRAA